MTPAVIAMPTARPMAKRRFISESLSPAGNSDLTDVFLLGARELG